MLDSFAPTGTADTAPGSYRATLAAAAKADPSPFPCPPEPAFAVSDAGTYDVSLTAPGGRPGFEARLTLTSPDGPGPFKACMDLRLPCGRGQGLCGTAVTRMRHLSLRIPAPGDRQGFRMVMPRRFGQEGALRGQVMFCPGPDDPRLNGDADFAPARKDRGEGRREGGEDGGEEVPVDGYTTYTIVKFPRLDAEGNPVMEGPPGDRTPVMDCYFWRGGKWWRIKDPDLKEPETGLIDLRDGTGNPNYEEAPEDVARELDRQIFPDGWDDFWEGYDEATARQLQGLKMTLGAFSGIDADTLVAIERDRNAGMSWDDIFLRYKWEIVIAIILSLPAGKLFGRMFGPMIRRFRRQLTSIPDRFRSARLRRELERLIRENEEKIRDLERRLRNADTAEERARLGRELGEASSLDIWYNQMLRSMG